MQRKIPNKKKPKNNMWSQCKQQQQKNTPQRSKIKGVFSITKCRQRKRESFVQRAQAKEWKVNNQNQTHYNSKYNKNIVKEFHKIFFFLILILKYNLKWNDDTFFVYKEIKLNSIINTMTHQPSHQTRISFLVVSTASSAALPLFCILSHILENFLLFWDFFFLFLRNFTSYKMLFFYTLTLLNAFKKRT